MVTVCSVPSPDLSFQPDEHLEVYVSAYENPNHFWIQILGVRSLQLDKLTEEMTRFYSGGNPVRTPAVITALLLVFFSISHLRNDACLLFQLGVGKFERCSNLYAHHLRLHLSYIWVGRLVSCVSSGTESGDPCGGWHCCGSLPRPQQMEQSQSAGSPALRTRGPLLRGLWWQRGTGQRESLQDQVSQLCKMAKSGRKTIVIKCREQLSIVNNFS